MDGLSLYKFFRCCNEAFGSGANAGAGANANANAGANANANAGANAGAQVNSLLLWNDAIYLNLYKKEVHSLAFTFGSGRASLSFVSDTFSSKQVGIFENLRGGIVEGFSTHGHDRIGFIDICKRRPSGKLQRFRLVFEIVGAMSNFFILDGETGRILYNLNQRNMDASRSIGVSHVYQPFSSNKSMTLSHYHTASEAVADAPEDSSAPVAEAYFSSLEGFSKPLVREAVALVELYGYGLALEYILHEINTGTDFYAQDSTLLPFTRYACGVDGVANGSKLPPENVVASESAYLAYNFLSPEMGAYLQSLTPRETTLRISVASSIRKGLKKYTKLCKGLRTELDNASNYEKYRQEADLLKMNLHTVRGHGVYNLTKYTPEGVETGIRYTYNSDLHVHDYMKRLYHRAGRLERGIPVIQERLNLMESYVKFYEEQEHYCETAPYGELLYMRSNVLLLGKKGDEPNAKNSKGKHKHNKHGSGGAKGRKKLDARLKHEGFYRFEIDGVLCMLGKNSRGNHELLREALPHDHWVHAKGIPSAHGIIRWSNDNTNNHNQEKLDTLIHTMARLVAHYTKTTNKQVEIDYTIRKNVRNVKGAPMGFVTYKGFKTIAVNKMNSNEVEQIIGNTNNKQTG